MARRAVRAHRRLGWRERDGSESAIRVTSRPDGGSYVRILERGIEPDGRSLYASLRAWQGGLNRLDRLR